MKKSLGFLVSQVLGLFEKLILFFRIYTSITVWFTIFLWWASFIFIAILFWPSRVFWWWTPFGFPIVAVGSGSASAWRTSATMWVGTGSRSSSVSASNWRFASVTSVTSLASGPAATGAWVSPSYRASATRMTSSVTSFCIATSPTWTPWSASASFSTLTCNVTSASTLEASTFAPVFFPFLAMKRTSASSSSFLALSSPMLIFS